MSSTSMPVRTLPPERIENPDAHDWNGEFDVVVVGFGGAGVSAALEAKAAGGEVAVVDRFMGGGATAICGSVFYGGGGTEQQKAAGLDDDPDNMFNYLVQETGDVVSEETLRRFCETSLENLQWLESHGVEFEGNLCPHKTSYPIHEYRLYYSGNELVPKFAETARPAARGHIAKGMGKNRAMGVPALFRPLKASALSKGVVPFYQSEARRLLTNADGQIIGIEIYQIPQDNKAAGWHKRWQQIATRLHMMHPGTANRFRKRAFKIEDDHAAPKHIRARRGVILSTGGFVFNRDMLKDHAPKYASGMPLGTTGDNGSGILLGQSVGGVTDHMDSVSAWRFINPPLAWPNGIIVDRQGERYCDESVYGATIGKPMFDEHRGEAIIILDHALYRTALTQLKRNYSQLVNLIPGFLNSHFNAKKADSIGELAREMLIPSEALEASVSTYNRATRGEIADPFGKDRKYMHALERGPFYAIDMSADSKFSPCPVLTLGGVKVNEETGQVQREDGSSIDRLYAAGRTAIGICSQSYVSGLSVADCVFSGRRAGHHAATQERDEAQPNLKIVSGGS